MAAFPVKRSEWNAMVGPVVDTHVKPETAKPYYSYTNFVKAARGFPAFYGGTPVDARREIAAFLAHLYQETRFVYNHEIRCHGVVCNEYGNTQWGSRHNLLAVRGCTRPEWDCRYFGRGPLQLSWYLNYLDASQAIYGDDRLARQPWLVTDDPVVGWTVALHFWMTNKGREPVTAHQAIRAGNFGRTISIINGNLECGPAWDTRPQTRVDKFVQYCAILGVPPPPASSLRC